MERLKAALEYEALKDRRINPRGKFDKQGRWYPDIMEKCCETIREPSNPYPYSLMSHCRTLPHVCEAHDVEVADVKKILKYFVKQATNKR